MAKVSIAIREFGSRKIEYSADFDLDVVPQISSYISIYRPDSGHWSAVDLIVRHVWYVLTHPAQGDALSNDIPLGRMSDVTLECEQAIGPYLFGPKRQLAEAAERHGVQVERFDVARRVIGDWNVP